MLHFKTELTQHGVGNILRILRTKINSDSLRSDQFYYGFNLLEQTLGSFLKYEMCLIDKYAQFGLWQIAFFGKFLI